MLTLRLIYHRIIDDDNRRTDGDRRTVNYRRVDSNRKAN